MFPELAAAETIDAFVSYLPSSDWGELTHGSDQGEVPYFEQVRWLDARFPSPTSYATQMVTNSKITMAKTFTAAGVPIPVTYDGSAPESQRQILSDIQRGKIMVFKPDFGGSGAGIIKVTRAEDAERAFAEYAQDGKGFPVQEYIEHPQIGDRNIDYRAFVIGDRVIAGIKRTTKPGEWRGNYSLGSTDVAHQFTPEQEADAVKAMQGAGLGFGSVDILIDPAGKHYICEIGDCLDLTSLDEVRPDLNLADIIVQQFERDYSAGAVPSARMTSFAAARDAEDISRANVVSERTVTGLSVDRGVDHE